MTDIKLGLQVDDKGSLKRAQAGMKSLSTSATQVDGKAKAMTNQFGALGTGMKAMLTTLGGVATLGGAFAGSMKLAAEYSKETERRLKNAQESAFAKVGLEALSRSGGVEAGATQTVTRLKMAMGDFQVSEQELNQAAINIGPIAKERGIPLGEALAVSLEAWARKGFQGKIGDVAKQLSMVLKTGEGELQAFALDPSKVRKEEARLGRTMLADEKARFTWAQVSKQARESSTLQELINSRDPNIRGGIARMSVETAISEQEDARSAEQARYNVYRQKKIAEQNVDPGNFWQSLLNLQIGDYFNAQTLNPASTIAGDWARRYKGSRSWRNIIRGLSPIMLAASAFTDGSSAQMPTVASPTQIQINIFPKGGE